MFGGKLGMGELIIILVIVLVLFGANKLPQLGAGLGQGIKSFKKAMSGEDEEKPSSTASNNQQQPPKQGQG